MAKRPTPPQRASGHSPRLNDTAALTRKPGKPGGYQNLSIRPVDNGVIVCHSDGDRYREYFSPRAPEVKTTPMMSPTPEQPSSLREAVHELREGGARTRYGSNREN